jgi:hypothetical protein
MLVYGTANPVGYATNYYDGFYLTDADIDTITPTMVGIPVKIEHKGGSVGEVVSAWKHNGRMDLVLKIDDVGIESEFGKEFVKRGICKDLSLGYSVQMSKSAAGFIRASNKKVLEVSLVKAGARDDCHIRGWGPETKHRIVI